MARRTASASTLSAAARPVTVYFYRVAPAPLPAMHVPPQRGRLGRDPRVLRVVRPPALQTPLRADRAWRQRRARRCGSYVTREPVGLILQDYVLQRELATQGGGGMCVVRRVPSCWRTTSSPMTTHRVRSYTARRRRSLPGTAHGLLPLHVSRQRGESYGGAVHAKWNPQGTFSTALGTATGPKRYRVGNLRRPAEPLVVNSILRENLPDQLASDPGAPPVAASFRACRAAGRGTATSTPIPNRSRRTKVSSRCLTDRRAGQPGVPSLRSAMNGTWTETATSMRCCRSAFRSPRSGETPSISARRHPFFPGTQRDNTGAPGCPSPRMS